jgi:hypothetical protein
VDAAVLYCHLVINEHLACTAESETENYSTVFLVCYAITTHFNGAGT